MKLVVTEPFGDFAKGEEITAPETVAAVLESHPRHVVKVATAEAIAEEEPK